MTQSRVRAVYMRGGTSRCLVFHERDLPRAGVERDYILLAALGSPDPYGRQLDGLGGGISSLSKACIIGPSNHPAAAVGPFAIEERLVQPQDGETLVRIHNTNTKKLIVARVPVAGSEPAVHGDFELPGVAGTGARIALDFIEPGGAGTGRLLPTGKPRDVIDGLETSLVDASIPMVFVRAHDLGIIGTETPQAIDGDKALSARLEKIRVAASHLMGIPGSAATPKIAVVTTPTEYTALDGSRVAPEQTDVVGRAISMANCHRAFPLTSSMCLAVAARIESTLVHECSTAKPGADVRLGHPSGVLPLDAAVTKQNGDYVAERVTVYRTARRLMEGYVRIP